VKPARGGSVPTEAGRADGDLLAARSTASPVGRRIVMAMGLLGIAGTVVGSSVQRGVARVLSALSPRGGGLASLVPGANRFRIYTVTGSFPIESTNQYRLSVSGLVDHPMTLRFDDLLAMPATYLSKDFQCVTGWRVPDVHWVGVQLSHILAAASLRPGAKAVLFSSFDGTYTESLTLDQAMRPDVIVAYEMLGKRPISTEHGGPVRLYVAPMYGYKSIKWLSTITVSDHVVPGYWENLGYDVNAWIGRSNGRSDAPVDGA
jgi:DMSO/TMAO reductase YedYZ molybdopterin-dependent catalytic subunit